MKELFEIANWASSKTFLKFYFKSGWNTSKDGHFATAVLKDEFCVSLVQDCNKINILCMNTFLYTKV